VDEIAEPVDADDDALCVLRRGLSGLGNRREERHNVVGRDAVVLELVKRVFLELLKHTVLDWFCEIFMRTAESKG